MDKSLIFIYQAKCPIFLLRGSSPSLLVGVSQTLIVFFNLYQLPYLIDGQVKITESMAVLKYIARKHGLVPNAEKDIIRADILEGAEFSSKFIIFVSNKSYKKIFCRRVVGNAKESVQRFFLRVSAVLSLFYIALGI